MSVSRVHEIVKEEWDYLVGLLPADIEELAVTTGALRRRRVVGSGRDLLRLALAYSVEDWSLRQTAAMARAYGWHVMSDVAVLKRLRACPGFLKGLISAVLRRRLEILPQPDLRVCVVDASTISRPGSQGTDWRLHLVYDLFGLQMHRVELTDNSQGETFARFEVRRDEVYLADRAYGTTPGLTYMLQQGGTFITRASLQQVRLQAPDGGALGLDALIPWLEELPDAEAAERQVAISSGEGIHPLRLVAVRKSPEAAERAVRRAIRDSRRKGHDARPETLVLAKYVVILTNCEPAVTLDQVLEAYRFRWQVELEFKRLKSLLHLNQLRAKDPALAQTYLLAKILAALLAEELIARAAAFSPWGFRLLPSSA